MRFSLSVALALASSTSALNILLNNDDGFGSSNIRELYRLLKEDGHDGTCFLDRQLTVAYANNDSSVDCSACCPAEWHGW